MKKTSEMLDGTHKRNFSGEIELHASEYECPGCGLYFNGYGTLSHHTERCQRALMLDGDDVGEPNEYPE